MNSTAQDDAIFSALGSAVRREILSYLRDGELPAGEIAARFDIAAPTISRHLGVLKNAGLVVMRRDQNRILYTAAWDRIETTLMDFTGVVGVRRWKLRKQPGRKDVP